MGQLFPSSRPRSFRTLHHICWRLTVTLIILSLFQQQHLFHVHRQSLAAKYSPTFFDPSLEELHTRLLRPDDESAQYRDDLIANNTAWKVLGSGWEGKVFAYQDLVIKTFTPGRSPFRNCAPDGSGEHWPTEITASLRFGRFSTQLEINKDGMHDENIIALEGFLPVKAYFKAAAASPAINEWHLVTPLVKGGSLNSLAKKIAEKDDISAFRETDAHYRPAFEKLLVHLYNLHNMGYCHDDIKPANIFVEADSHWILGDLGNLRETAHPYHSSRLWADNNQLADCRANDVMRALKSYLKFVQSASSDQDRFNKEFFDGREPLSRLYWRTIAKASALSAKDR